MAGELYGPHLFGQCQDCGISFRCGLEYVPSELMAVCPNCGFNQNRLELTARKAGKRVVIDRWADWMRGPKIWQAVAFSSPHDSNYLIVKRLVAHGKGEIELHNGDLFVDGRIQRKSLDQLRQMRILVYDDHYRPTRSPKLPTRWHGKDADSRWRLTSTGYVHDRASVECGSSQPPPGDPVASIDWLEYTQWTCWLNPAPPLPRTGPAPIVDHYAYNQNLARSGLHPVSDIMLQCKTTINGTGQIVFRIDDGVDRFELELGFPDLLCRLWHNESVVWQGQRALQRQPWSIEFAVCDQRVLTAINGRTLLEHSYEPSDIPRRTISTPLALGTTGPKLEVESLQVYRDVYYLGPNGQRHWAVPQPLGPDQWFALGDNVPVSIDSRQTGPVSADAIIGPVYPLAD